MSGPGDFWWGFSDYCWETDRRWDLDPDCEEPEFDPDNYDDYDDQEDYN